MIGIRFDPLTERWQVLVLPSPERALAGEREIPPIAIAWKRSENDARTFAYDYIHPPSALEEVLHQVDATAAVDALPEPTPRDKAIEAVMLACRLMDHTALVALARTAAKLMPIEPQEAGDDES